MNQNSFVLFNFNLLPLNVIEYILSALDDQSLIRFSCTAKNIVNDKGDEPAFLQHMILVNVIQEKVKEDEFYNLLTKKKMIRIELGLCHQLARRIVTAADKYRLTTDEVFNNVLLTRIDLMRYYAVLKDKNTIRIIANLKLLTGLTHELLDHYGGNENNSMKQLQRYNVLLLHRFVILISNLNYNLGTHKIIRNKNIICKLLCQLALRREIYNPNYYISIVSSIISLMECSGECKHYINLNKRTADKISYEAVMKIYRKFIDEVLKFFKVQFIAEEVECFFDFMNCISYSVTVHELIQMDMVTTIFELFKRLNNQYSFKYISDISCSEIGWIMRGLLTGDVLFDSMSLTELKLLQVKARSSYDINVLDDTPFIQRKLLSNHHNKVEIICLLVDLFQFPHFQSLFIIGGSSGFIAEDLLKELAIFLEADFFEMLKHIFLFTKNRDILSSAQEDKFDLYGLYLYPYIRVRFRDFYKVFQKNKESLNNVFKIMSVLFDGYNGYDFSSQQVQLYEKLVDKNHRLQLAFNFPFDTHHQFAGVIRLFKHPLLKFALIEKFTTYNFLPQLLENEKWYASSLIKLASILNHIPFIYLEKLLFNNEAWPQVGIVMQQRDPSSDHYSDNIQWLDMLWNKIDYLIQHPYFIDSLYPVAFLITIYPSQSFKLLFEKFDLQQLVSLAEIDDVAADQRRITLLQALTDMSCINFLRNLSCDHLINNAQTIFHQYAKCNYLDSSLINSIATRGLFENRSDLAAGDMQLNRESDSQEQTNSDAPAKRKLSSPGVQQSEGDKYLHPYKKRTI